MISKRMKLLPALFLCVAAAACGPSEGFQQVPWDMAIDANTQLERLQGLAPTTENNMPTTGSASYTGSALLRLDPNTFAEFDDIAIVADAAIDVDFSGAGNVTGRIDGYEAVTGAGTALQTRVPSSGEILIGEDESLVGTAGLNNAWAADYRGNINVDGTNYIVDNVLIGGFLGNRTRDPTPERITKGIVGGIDTLPPQFATSNGVRTPFDIVVIGETPR